MGSRQLRAAASCLIVSVLVFPCSTAIAQEHEPSILKRAITMTLIDPTTTAPAILTYDGTMRDWNTSQVFFRNGFVEQNARFTTSGRPFDTAVSYETGRQQILRDSLSVLAVSAVHNFTTQVIEQSLRERYPEHRTAVTVFGWIERTAVASMMSYQLAGPHYRQWKANQQLAGQLGIH